MNKLIILPHAPAPALIAAAGDRAVYRFLEFFTMQIRNSNTNGASVQAKSPVFIEKPLILTPPPTSSPRR
ncbi:MAG TPA: hypothetical protein VH414_00720 [Lichenihabitans sp.]|jgi:hypothetical protein|nr:hypothetical protein [Lichenihabitans sp.]